MHTPFSAVLQFCPPPGLPLSRMPSQSSSCALQISGEGCTFCTHTVWPTWHAVMPGEHAPNLPVVQLLLAMPLSTVPSQSSSSLLHVSAPFAMSCLHTCLPASQWS